ncbi:MAG TPA: DUF418 domain-containing protein [Flavisolibacter sp.]|nr:DUF418 domain-containing protein [Flavisolibacter sp.]
MSQIVTAAPTSQGERIHLLDSLRGIAVLGILLMNIPGFALPRIVLHNPNLLDFTGANFYSWYGIELFMEGSQRAIFSMLFGAGMLLFISRLQDRTSGLIPAEYYFKRQLWLLLFGLINAYVLLWFWDILFHYAILGMLLFAFRGLKPKHLLITAAVCLVLQTTRENVDFYRDKQVISRGEVVAAIDTTKTKLDAFQKEHFTAYMGMKTENSVESKKSKMEKNIREVQHSYSTLYNNHSEASMFGQTGAIFHFIFFDVLLFMFIGMAFYKNGILTGQHKARTYWWLFGIGLGVGLVISYYRIQPRLQNNFDHILYLKNASFEFYELSRTLRAIGIFGGIMLLYKSGFFKWFFNLMKPVGQMAFTNYLAQSLMCGLFFYGVGFGYFGKLQFHQMYYVVAAVWAIEIIWSHLWLRHFRYGPMEWLWRSLTYWKFQPFKKTKDAEPVSAEKTEELSVGAIAVK